MNARAILCALVLALAASGGAACEGILNITTWALTCTGPCDSGTCHEVTIYDPETGFIVAHYCTCDGGDATPDHCYLKHYQDEQGAHLVACVKDCENLAEVCVLQGGPVMGTVKCGCQ